MSQMVVAVSWDRGAIAAPEAATEVADALGRWRSDSRRIVECPGAVLGQSTVASDRWRRADTLPRCDESKKLSIVADCRLDNRAELRRELSASDSTPDSALLLMAYERWDADMASHLLGDFAVAIWDWDRRRLVAIKDHLGVKPLFYMSVPGGIVLASDVELLIEIVRPRPVPDDHRVVEYLLWDYQSTDRTFWSAVGRLPGGHVLDGSARGHVNRRYWRPSLASFMPGNASSTQETFRELFFKSVERRLGSDRPILAHLSGGVDSSAIVCVADRIYRDRPHEFPALHVVSERYLGMSCDEGPYIQAVAEAVQFPAEEWDGRVPDFEDLNAPSWAGPATRVLRNSGSTGDRDIARRLGSQAVLGGLGGDQLGAPTGLADDLVEARMLAFLRDTVRMKELSAAVRWMRAWRAARLLAPRALRQAWGVRRYRRRLPRWLHSRWHDLAVGFARDADMPVAFGTHVQQAHWRELTSARVAHSLDLEQRYYAVCGMEARFPFLDKELVEFVLSLEPKHWPRPHPFLRMQREALADVLPDAIRRRMGKALFAVASSRRNRLAAELLSEILSGGQSWAAERWVDRSEVAKLWRRFSSERPVRIEDERAVWRIATLEVWLRAIFGYGSPLGRECP